MQGDSDQLLFGGGTGGSRSAMMGGTALLTACDKVIEQGKQLAAHFLEASVADIEFSEGKFRIVGTDRSIGIMEVAQRVKQGAKLPAELPQTIDASLVMETPPSAYPNGCHIAEVEIDPDTGTVSVVKYAMVNDFGNLLNPLLAEGQAHGGVVQGIGQALMERTVYDREGQLISGSYMDYAMPRADDAPSFEFGSHPVPATTNPLGVKGCGEAGCAGALAGGDERGDRRAETLSRAPYRHAGDARAGVARHSRGARMILEIAQIDVKAGLESEFEAGVKKAVPIFQRAKGCKGLELKRSVEKPRRYRLLVSWETLENHTVDFRGSPDFAEWRKLRRPLFRDRARSRARRGDAQRVLEGGRRAPSPSHRCATGPSLSPEGRGFK